MSTKDKGQERSERNKAKEEWLKERKTEKFMAKLNLDSEAETYSVHFTDPDKGEILCIAKEDIAAGEIGEVDLVRNELTEDGKIIALALQSVVTGRKVDWGISIRQFNNTAEALRNKGLTIADVKEAGKDMERAAHLFQFRKSRELMLIELNKCINR